MRKREAEAVAVAAAGKSARILHQFMDKAAELFQDMVAVILSVRVISTDIYALTSSFGRHSVILPLCLKSLWT